MKIRDIANRDIVNLSNCDQEPIHIPGSIQSHGFLLALTETLHIDYCSGNLQDFIPLQHTQLLTKHISGLITERQLQQVNVYIAGNNSKSTEPLIIDLFEKNYHCSIHKSEQSWIFEFEPIPEKLPALSTVYDQTLQFVQYMQYANSLQELCDKVAQEIRSLTGYDRVMVYRFDKDYNGEVYAERKREDLEAFLGLHYPHTDIPVQARALYIKNLLRIIVDVNYTPVPIYTIDDAHGKNLDMSYSILRSTSPIHVQYLHNMGVGATLTISLLHDGKLWGLIACHHYSPKFIDHYTRINAQLQGHFLTSQISVRVAAEEYAIAKETNVALEKILNEQFPSDRSSLQEIVSHPSLLSLCNAAGVAFILDGVMYKNGNTPNDQEIGKIAAWGGPYSKQRFFNSSRLATEFPEAADYCSSASGIIFYTLRSLKDACIIWFNPETLEEVTWAGDPQKAIEKNEHGLSPRKSFESWKQVTKCQAREWKDSELSAAANYAYALQKHVTFILLNEEEVRQRLLTEQLKETNAELENINWISTHDLKEPLRKIQLFSSRLLESDEELSAGTGETIKKISNFSNRMQSLIESLSVYAKTKHTDESFAIINVEEKLQLIIADMQDEINTKNAVVNIGTLPVIKAIPVLLQQLFVNLIGNALKFSAKDRIPTIDIHAETEPLEYYPAPGILFYKITVKDNGIGFNPTMNESIFKIFSRLHSTRDYEGSGVGLALCRKIMQLHRGYIEASGNENTGAVFNLYFPVGKL